MVLALHLAWYVECCRQKQNAVLVKLLAKQRAMLVKPRQIQCRAITSKDLVSQRTYERRCKNILGVYRKISGRMRKLNGKYIHRKANCEKKCPASAKKE